MSKLEELIQELCPNGVDKFELQQLFITRNGYTPSKSKSEFWENGTIPWFRMEDIRENGNILSDSLQHVNACAVKGQLFPKNSIIVATSATVGEHALITVPSLANQRFTCLMIRPEYRDMFEPKFLFYYCYKLDEYCLQNLKKSSFASVDMNKFSKFKFSVPPLEVQREIVRILDSFTLLTAELTARNKQYEYYRDDLLTFGNDIHIEKLKSVAKISRGVRVTKSQLSDEGYPVYQNALAPMGYYSKYNTSGGTTYVISAGAAGEIGFSNEDFWAADDCLVLTELNGVTNKYIYHFLMTKKDFIKSRVRKASIPRLSREVIENLSVPIPSIEVQNRIVNTLDKFDAICNDLNIGLPAEIEARQKQYEYYRDLLLTFAETGKIIATDRQTDRQ